MRLVRTETINRERLLSVRFSLEHFPFSFIFVSFLISGRQRSFSVVNLCRARFDLTWAFAKNYGIIGM